MPDVQNETAPAQELAQAAATLRRLLADLGDNRGPWYIANQAKYPYPQSIRNTGVPYVVADTYTDPPHAPSEARYICAMHPGVGAALAEWLEQAVKSHLATLTVAGKTWASVMDPRAVAWIERMTDTHALALARLINRTQEQA